MRNPPWVSPFLGELLLGKCAGAGTFGSDGMGDFYRYKPLSYFALAFVLSWVPWSFAAYYSYQRAMDLLQQFVRAACWAGAFFCSSVSLSEVSGIRDLKPDFKERLVDLKLIRPGYIPVILFSPMPFALLLSTWLSVGLADPRLSSAFQADW